MVSPTSPPHYSPVCKGVIAPKTMTLLETSEVYRGRQLLIWATRFGGTPEMFGEWKFLHYFSIAF